MPAMKGTFASLRPRAIWMFLEVSQMARPLLYVGSISVLLDVRIQDNWSLPFAQKPSLDFMQLSYVRISSQALHQDLDRFTQWSVPDLGS